MAVSQWRWRPLMLALALLLSPLGPVACAASGPSQELGCGTGGVPCLKGKALVELKTSRGVVQVSLDGDAAPLTAGNFVDLVRRDDLDGIVLDYRGVADDLAPVYADFEKQFGKANIDRIRNFR